MALYLGVDAGGTHTRAAVVDEHGVLRGRGAAGRGKVEDEAATAAEAIYAATAAALAGAGADLSDIAAACLAVAGLDSESQFSLLRDALSGRGLVGAQLENDTLAAWAGGTGLRPGVVAIGGTGHNVLAVDAAGRRCLQQDLDRCNRLIALPRAGWIVGWTALGLGLAAPEGSPLHRATLSYLGAADVASAMETLRSGDRVPGRGFAEMAAMAADAGDPLAALALRAAGTAIGADVAIMLRWMGMATEPCPVVYVGGLFRAPDVLAAFRAVVEGACPRAQVGQPLLPPVLGAVLLAMGSAGPTILEALAASARTMHLP